MAMRIYAALTDANMKVNIGKTWSFEELYDLSLKMNKLEMNSYETAGNDLTYEAKNQFNNNIKIK